MPLRKRIILSLRGFIQMKNKITIFFLSILSLSAAPNDNPFINTTETNTSIITPQSFEREELNFPSDARIVKSINITYVALDGSEKKMDIDINKSIDWHDDFVLMKLKKISSSPNLDVSVTLPSQNSEINSTLNIELPVDSGKIGDFLGYTLYKKRIKIASEDEIIGDFIIGNPSKIILDFKKDIIFQTQSIKINKDSAFNRLQIGSHKGYYRLVLYLDGKYNYRLEKNSTGYTLYLE